MKRGGLASGLRWIFVGLVLLPASGCYAMALDEFDSVARWSDPLIEPERVSWSAMPSQYSWYSVLINTDAAPYEEDNPSGFARERLEDLVAMMGSDPSRIAQVARRLLWVADRDQNPFNRISAIRGMETILRELGTDLLDPSMYYEAPDIVEGRKIDAELRATHRIIQVHVSRPGRTPLTAEQREVYVSAIRRYTVRPLPLPNWRRMLIRIMWSVYVVETDVQVRELARRGLLRAVEFAVCTGLRAALIPLGSEDFPAARLEALQVFRRVGGIAAVPFLLKMMRRPLRGQQNRYDRDERVRMFLVRICAQLKLEHARRRHGDGATPVEFLYYTAIDDEEEEGLRRVALEGLSRCLHKELGTRRVSHDSEWAKEWWRKEIANRSGQQPSAQQE